MNKRRLDPALFASTTWMIEPGAGESLVAAVLSGNTEVDVPEEPVVYEYQYGYFPKADYAGSVAVVSFSGIIYADWSLSYIMEQLRRIAADENVTAVVLKVNSPGGSVDAAEMFSDQLINYPLPIVAHINYGMAGSSGYMLAASCDKITASRARDQVGSIGSYIRWQDWKGYNEKLGLKQRDIYARQSTEKNLESREAEKGNFKGLEDDATEACAAFIDFVKERRATTLVETEGMDPFKGRVFSATDAQQIGLIDQICSLDEAIKLARTLATNASTNQSNTQMIAGYVKLGALNALAGVAADAVTETQIDALNKELAEKGYNVVAVRAADLDAANTAGATISRLEGELKAANDKNTSLEGEVTRLGKQPGDKPTEIKGATDPVVQGASEEEDWKKKMDNLPHNVALDAQTR